MKKYYYLCVFISLYLNMTAQIDLDDGTWFSYFDYSFSNSNFSWNNTTWRSMDGVWKAYPHNQVTHGIGQELQIYQVSNCIHDIDSQQMILTSEYDFNDLIPNHQYQLPASMNGNYPNPLNQNNYLYYFSGEIDVDNSLFRYGYFEIRCKLPIHQGAFPAFWLWNSGNYYEEIDMFEFSWAFEDSLVHGQNQHPHGAGNPYCFTTGIYFNNSRSYPHYTYARNYPMIGDSLSNWHTFGCEWMPGYVKWYCDGNIVNDFHEKEHIPHRSLVLKTNYAIDKYVLPNQQLGNLPTWFDGDAMTIDYIKVWQHHWDCDTDEVITCQFDLDTFDGAVKKSISICPTTRNITLGSTDKKTFLVTDSFEITGPFQANNGGEMSIKIIDCPDTN